MRFDILTIFPGMFASPLQFSLIKKALERRLVEINIHDIRDFAVGKHRVTDDEPYGGGGGMVMKVEPIERAVSTIVPNREGTSVILFSPRGETFSQKVAEELTKFSRLVFICGHYEGVDERVREFVADRELSIGDYVLTGGELSALVVLDAVVRLLPGVLGNAQSARDDSFSTGLLEHPHYTRPAEYKGWRVPEVLLKGNHREIQAWRRRESLKKTFTRRPDLLDRYFLSAEEKRLLEEIMAMSGQDCRG